MTIIKDVERKLALGERLGDADALALFETAELVEIGELADEANRKKNKDIVFYNINRHINPTNICALSCKFCAYSRKPGEDGAYAYSIAEMVTKAGEAVAQGATEVHMVGGLHPRWRFDYYKEMIAAIKTAYPDLHLKAFTAVELDWLARKARKTILEVLEELRAAGLGSLPGGGAEIFHPEIREAICDTKVPAEAWLSTHRIAHQLGMKSNATMLYGHIESYHHRVDHMRRLRELQDETHGFNAFIPLSFQPFQNEMGIDRYTFGYDDLKTIAIARLYLDNFQHIKAYWIMLGQDVAQMALQYGASDLDGTVIEEKISRMAGGRAGMAMSKGLIETLVRKAQRIPMERDTLYNMIGKPETLKKRQGAGADEQELSLNSLVNKAKYGDYLTPDDLVRLAIEAKPFELAHLARTRRDESSSEQEAGFTPAIVLPLSTLKTVRETVDHVRASYDEAIAKYRMAPTSLAIDLAGVGSDTDEGTHDLGMLLEFVWALKQSFRDLDLSLRGFKGLWALAQREGSDVSDVLKRLKEAGTDLIATSPKETEADITHSEIIELHAAIHELDMLTIGKAELAAPANGSGEPLWESFVRRIDAFAQLAQKTGGLAGLTVEVSPGSFVTSAEYLRAVALARIAATGIRYLVTPLASIPVMSPAQGLGTASFQLPAEKIAPMTLHYGASDLGTIDVTELSPIAVMQQIRSAGYLPAIKDAKLAPEGPRRKILDLVGVLRHVPEGVAQQL